MVILETAAVVGAYKYIKHRKHKKEREANAFSPTINPVYAPSCASSQPPSYSTAVLASTQQNTPSASQPYTHEKCVDSSPEVSICPQPSPNRPEQEWRPVYMLERSISSNSYNNIRTHRAIFVGEFQGDRGTGKAHEIRKKAASILGVQIPFKRTMTYTDAEQWVGDKALDRPPVLLGYTDWTNEELNREGGLRPELKLFEADHNIHRPQNGRQLPDLFPQLRQLPTLRRRPGGKNHTRRKDGSQRHEKHTANLRPNEATNRSRRISRPRRSFLKSNQRFDAGCSSTNLEILPFHRGNV